MTMRLFIFVNKQKMPSLEKVTLMWFHIVMNHPNVTQNFFIGNDNDNKAFYFCEQAKNAQCRENDIKVVSQYQEPSKCKLGIFIRKYNDNEAFYFCEQAKNAQFRESHIDVVSHCHKPSKCNLEFFIGKDNDNKAFYFGEQVKKAQFGESHINVDSHCRVPYKCNLEFYTGKDNDNDNDNGVFIFQKVTLRQLHSVVNHPNATQSL